MFVKRSKSPADVCLVLEGTYPYVSGGVSTWVHQIVTQLSDLKFAILYIGAEKALTGEPKYELPENVVSLSEIHLFDPLPSVEKEPARLTRAASRRIYGALTDLIDHHASENEQDRLLEFFSQVAEDRGKIRFANLWSDREPWELLCAIYDENLPDQSFLDFYWTSRFLVQPVWRVLRGLRDAPAARLYHSVCTGYAGVAATLAAHRANAPFLLSEHGIYVKERIAEIRTAPWIHDPEPRYPPLLEDLGKLRRTWIELFKLFARFAYRHSDRIISLFARNARLQVEFGAPAEKIEIIPNGVDVPALDALVAESKGSAPLPDPSGGSGGSAVVGFLGRIVAIKDVKTLVRAAHLVLEDCPGARFIVAGPKDEEPGYHEECLALAAQFGIADRVRFPGPMKREDLLARIDIMVLTSFSEGLPFVILESFAAGIPVVATDVGACRELVGGRPGEDPPAGAAGFVTPIGEPRETAASILSLIENPKLRLEMGENGRRRVETAYRQEDVTSRYHALYTGLPSRPESPTARRQWPFSVEHAGASADSPA